jgi:sugar phosphate isomerase/epimerase
VPFEPDDLVFCAGTHLATPLLDRLKPARAAGYAGVSVLPYEIEQLRAEGLRDADIRARVEDAGLAISELDAITTWLPGEEPPATFPADLAAALRDNTPERVCAMGESIGARSVTIVEYYGATPGTDAAAEAFAAACDVAARHGLLLQLEFLPWTGIADLSTAWDIVRVADRANGGLLVDSWHVYRSGSTLEQLARVPGDKIVYVQLDDAPATPERDLADETQHRRLVPGRGDLDLVGLVRTLDRVGYRGPYGVEVFSDELVRRPVADVAAETADATRRVLAEARQP